MVVNVVKPVKKEQETHHVQDAYVMTHVRMGQMVATVRRVNVIAL